MSIFTYRAGMRTTFRLLIFIWMAMARMNAYSLQQDTVKTIQLKEVVVSASRFKEDITTSPVSIERMSQSDIRQSAAPSFFDAIENIKGVQMITPSIGFKVINTRGFATTTNVRFVQLVDGVDNQAPHIGAPIGNTLGPGDLDIERVEIIPGVATALYGMNAINGLAGFITKDPFTHTGLSIQQKIGFNRPGIEGGIKPFSETSFRWAHAINTRLGFKINGTYLTGTDFVASNQTDLNPDANISTGLTGSDNPAIDPVNAYGNESSNRRTLSLNGKNYVVARTGYQEKDVANYTIQNLKGDASIHYLINPGVRLSYTYRFAQLDNVYQRSNRFRLEDYRLQQHSLSLQGKSIQLRAYLTLENTGKSYNLRSMAENIDRNFKPDNLWYQDYAGKYTSAMTGGEGAAVAHHLARQTADAGRPQPGTSEFQKLIAQLGDINNWDYGAALRVQSSLFHIEGQIDLTEQWLRSFFEKTRVKLLTGFDHRTYIVVPDGNYFINPTDSGQHILYSKTGAFIRASRGFFSDKLSITATLRADKNEFYPVKWNPRITAVYSPASSHNFRISWQNGFRFPSIFEGFSNINSGGVKRVGGFPVMSSGIFENGYFRSSVDEFQASINRDVNTLGLTKNEAIVKNAGVLVKNDYTYIQPEQISSLEFGYRSLWADNRLQADVDFYFNNYQGFIAQVELNIPETQNPDSVAFYLADKDKQDRYRLWTNSKTTAFNYGSSIGLRYNFYKGFNAMANATYSMLNRKSSNDGLEDGFNTPRWITHISIGNEKLFRSLGFMVTYRWQSSYYWQSFLVNGNVPAYQTVDAQLSCVFNKVRWKVGGTNVFNSHYYSYLGGPSLGGFYYTSVSLNLGD